MALSGKLALVTGASSGIGAAVSARLGAAGARVALLARNEARLQATAAACGAQAASCLQADVRDRHAVRAAVQSLEETPQVVVHCSGLWAWTLIQNGHEEHYDELIDVHCKGTVNVVQSVLPGMLAAKDGHMVLLTSNAGR